MTIWFAVVLHFTPPAGWTSRTTGQGDRDAVSQLKTDRNKHKNEEKQGKWHFDVDRRDFSVSEAQNAFITIDWLQ
ncbi:hypothetical protein BC940DRAFT_298846 [Gongronella butleri]|nr:hypothetical protein BC940DRAFT_298846 [Gongronella butleri]